MWDNGRYADNRDRMGLRSWNLILSGGEFLQLRAIAVGKILDY